MLNRLLVLVVVAAGCGSSEMALDRSGGSEPAPSQTTTNSGAADSGSSTVDETQAAAWYAIDLSFVLQDDGSWTDGQTALSVSLFGADEQPLCAFAVPVVAVGQVPPPLGDTSVYGWWQVDLGDGPVAGGCPNLSWEARRWWIGIGAYDVRLDPALEAVGLTGDGLYGLYLQEATTAPIYVLGYALHAEQLDTGAAAGGAPLPPGTYEASTLVLMTAR
jgi:hypothetical protein